MALDPCKGMRGALSQFQGGSDLVLECSSANMRVRVRVVACVCIRPCARVCHSVRAHTCACVRGLPILAHAKSQPLLRCLEVPPMLAKSWPGELLISSCNAQAVSACLLSRPQAMLIIRLLCALPPRKCLIEGWRSTAALSESLTVGTCPRLLLGMALQDSPVRVVARLATLPDAAQHQCGKVHGSLWSQWR